MFWLLTQENLSVCHLPPLIQSIILIRKGFDKISLWMHRCTLWQNRLQKLLHTDTRQLCEILRNMCQSSVQGCSLESKTTYFWQNTSAAIVNSTLPVCLHHAYMVYKIRMFHLMIWYNVDTLLLWMHRRTLTHKDNRNYYQLTTAISRHLAKCVSSRNALLRQKIELKMKGL